MNIKEAAKVLEDKYLTYPDVYRVNIMDCKGCGGKYIAVFLNTHNAKLMAAIPSNVSGFRIEKIHQSAPRYSENEVEIYAPQYYAYPVFGYPYGFPYHNRYPRPIHAPRLTFRRK